MAKKSFNYAYMEGLQQEMLRDENVVYLYQYQTPVAFFEKLKPIDLTKEFGKPRVDYTGIDEAFQRAYLLGASRPGLRPITIIPAQADSIGFTHISQGSKMQWGSDGDDPLPFVMVQEMSGQGPGGGQAHSHYDCDSWFMHMPSVKVVVPTTAYDAKGLLIASIQSDDPVVYLLSGAFRRVADEVPDEPYVVPIGKPAIRSKGTDITIVTHGNGVNACNPAVEELKKEGISVEYIDLRTLKPLDRKTLVESVKKTGRLLTVDPGSYTLAPGAEVVATCAQGVPGAKFWRLAFPDVPMGSAPEMAFWQVVTPEQVVIAAKALLKK